MFEFSQINARYIGRKVPRNATTGIVIVYVLKIASYRPLFRYFRLFYKQFTVNNCSIEIADDWI